MQQYYRSHFVPLASVHWAAMWHTHGISVGFQQLHSSVEHTEEIYIWISSEIWFFLHRTAKSAVPAWVYQPLKLYWEARSRDFAKTNLEVYISFCSRAELSLLFCTGGLEMLSVFPHNVCRNGVLTCDILPGRKPHIQGHDCHLSVQTWLNTNSLPCSLTSKTPKSSAHDFFIAGLNINSKSLLSRPAKLRLTSTI